MSYIMPFLLLFSSSPFPFYLSNKWVVKVSFFWLFFFLSFSSRLFSHYLAPFVFTPNHNHNVDDVVVYSFNRMLQMCSRPSILEFNKVLGSLAAFPPAISLSQQMELIGIEQNIVIGCYGQLCQMTFGKVSVLMVKFRKYCTYIILINGLCKIGCIIEPW